MQRDTLLIITDISGFTRFVAESDPETGINQAREMLEIIINTNSLGLELCEIEGDAVFFYLKNQKPTPDMLINQVRTTFRAFQEYLFKHGLQQRLGIKFFIHVGDCQTLKVGGETRLFGVDVIKIHRLLKGADDAPNYLLVTQDAAGYLAMPALKAERREIRYEYLGQIAYFLFDDNFLWVHPTVVRTPSLAARAGKWFRDLAGGRYGEVPRRAWLKTVLSA